MGIQHEQVPNLLAHRFQLTGHLMSDHTAIAPASEEIRSLRLMPLQYFDVFCRNIPDAVTRFLCMIQVKRLDNGK